MTTVMDTLLPEILRDNLPYKMAALNCVADIVEKQELDYFAKIADCVLPLLESVSAIVQGICEEMNEYRNA